MVLNGSPRPDGNTAALLDLVAEGARAAGATVAPAVQINSLKSQGCQGCRKCKAADAAGCVLNDALTPVLAEMQEADAWVIGTPIYMGNVSGQTKLLTDRLYGFTGQDGMMRLPAGKRAVIVITQGVRDEGSYRPVADLLAQTLKRRGFVSVETVVGAGSDGAARGSIHLSPKLEEKARQAGAALVQAR
jgi:multimeric flavodoxin WrbA